MSDLTGLRVLITGAGRGLGRACAEAVVDAGGDVIAVARSAADLDDLAAARPGQIEPWVMDVADSAFHARVAALPRLDGFVNNAGFNRPQPFTQVDVETLDGMLALNVRAAFLTAQAAAKVMVAQGSGVIVNMTSQMGHVGSPGRTVYCLTKHALEGLTKAAAVELAPHGVRVVSLAPTFIETPMTAPMLADEAFGRFVLDRIPLGRVGTAAEVAGACVFLLSPAASLVTGSSLLVDGGWTAQ
ncbi:SDR family NAD(P)-dependent oxidoreductase [Brevundimonas aurifodinae]|uniref:SDR family oxidoreductase n=2 Tax=Brevundimonas TaxID=41275 RepID=A0ABV1NMF1_9CAUL|nr:MAG: 3-oxoacyl-ACP reductase [Brevundimonas sp. 12-68-7]OYX31591.1 MAG: 3-oxoacyl-ACP reductase [Brevundimonas subvibrioides]